MTDVLDEAQEIEEAEREASIRRVRTCHVVPLPKGDTACRGCGDDIEAERLAAHPGARLCLECQEARERLQCLFRRPS